MKKQIALSVIFLILIGQICLLATAQKDTNYWHYHELIYKAECAIFDSNKIDAGFQYYDHAFNNFEFNYVHDLMNAAQLAHFYHRDYMKYLKRGVGYGLRPAHLSYIPAWKKMTVKKEFLEYFKSDDGKKTRQAYLATINQDYLAWLYHFSLEELKYRRSPDPNRMYEEHFAKWDEELLQKINEYGYPGAKIIGINDSLLYKNLNNNDLNYNQLVFKSADSLCLAPLKPLTPMVLETGDTIWVKDNTNEMDCPELSYWYLGQTAAAIYMVHNPCPFKVFLNIYDEIAKGNLHPREYTVLIDQSRMHTEKCDCGKYSTLFFRIGNFSQADFFKKYFMPEDETDALRKQYWIIPLHVERAKASFAEKYGYRFNWGMNNCFK